jgi:predicted aspartyl protease
MRFRFCAGIIAIALLASATHAEVPLTWDSTDHVVVPTYVNGKGPYDFILDTGADETGIYKWLAKSLQLPASGTKDLSGATGDNPITTVRLSTLAVDGHTIDHVDADVLPPRVDGAMLGGVAGVDVIANRLAVIDFQCKTFALLPIQQARPDIVGAGSTMIKAGSIRDGNQLTLPVTINGAAGIAVLDTGARNTYINHKFAEAAGIHPGSDAFHDAAPVRGTSMTAVTARIGPIGEVRFAGITRRDAVARVVDLPFFKGAGLAGGPAMDLGLDLLHGTRLTVDYSSRRFWLSPSSCASSKAENP